LTAAARESGVCVADSALDGDLGRIHGDGSKRGRKKRERAGESRIASQEKRAASPRIPSRKCRGDGVDEEDDKTAGWH
jgi:hypothetical protein